MSFFTVIQGLACRASLIVKHLQKQTVRMFFLIYELKGIIKFQSV